MVFDLYQTSLQRASRRRPAIQPQNRVAESALDRSKFVARKS